MTLISSWDHRRRRHSCQSIIELSIAMMCMLHTATIWKNRGAEAFHMTPPRSCFPPPEFDGRGRRRYDEDEEDLFQGEEDWFYPHHHPSDGHHFYGDNYDDLPPFPPPPPPYQQRHPRFVMDRPYPHFTIPNNPMELSQSQLFTTTTTIRQKTEHLPDDIQQHHHRHRQQVVSTGEGVKSIWKTSSPVLVQSSALQTFAFETPTVERVQVLLKTGQHRRYGRSRDDNNPLLLQARIDVWHGPDSTPQNLAIYIEDEDEYDDDLDWEDGGSPEDNDVTTNFSAIIETPQGYNTIAIRNTASDCDLLACVEGEECHGTTYPTYNNGDPSGYYYEEPYGIPHLAHQQKNNVKQRQNDKDGASTTTSSSPLQSVIERLMATSTPQRIEGTATNTASIYATSSSVDTPTIRPDVHTVRLARNVASVQVLLRTEYMRPLQARVELILKEQSCSNNKKDPGRVLKRTIVEVFSEDGMHRPFFAALETPRKNNRKRKLQKSEECDDDDDDNEEKKYSVSLRVINLSGSEFPIFASVEPHVIDTTNKNNSDEAAETTTHSEETTSGPSNIFGDGENQVDDDGILEADWWEHSMEKSHFGGGSHYDLRTNSTILDAEIL